MPYPPPPPLCPQVRFAHISHLMELRNFTTTCVLAPTAPAIAETSRRSRRKSPNHRPGCGGGLLASAVVRRRCRHLARLSCESSVMPQPRWKAPPSPHFRGWQAGHARVRSACCRRDAPCPPVQPNESDRAICRQRTPPASWPPSWHSGYCQLP